MRLIRSLLFRSLHLGSQISFVTRKWREYLFQASMYGFCQLLSLTHPVRDREISCFVVSLNGSDRMKWIGDLADTIPSLQIWEAVDGYDPLATMAAFGQSGLSFHGWLEEWRGKKFNRYGVLACFLPKYYLLVHQARMQYPFVIFLEDDIFVDKCFWRFAKNACLLFKIFPSLNMVRLGPLGEGYITSMDGAQRIASLIRETGMIEHSDMQLRNHCGPEISLARLNPISGLVDANCGDTNQTALFSQKDMELLLGAKRSF